MTDTQKNSELSWDELEHKYPDPIGKAGTGFAWMARLGELLLLSAIFSYAADQSRDVVLWLFAKVLQVGTIWYMISGILKFVTLFSIAYRPSNHRGWNGVRRAVFNMTCAAVSVGSLLLAMRGLENAIRAIVASSN